MLAVCINIIQVHRTEPKVHTTPKKTENAALFLRLGLPFTHIRHENETFGKRSSNRTNLKTPASRFSVDGKHFENGAFRNNHIKISIFFLLASFPQTQIQNERRLLYFQISPTQCTRTTFGAFSD